MKRHTKPYPPRAPRLFAEPARPPEASQGAYVAEIDGASRGNPGPAAYAVLIRRPTGEVLGRVKKQIGQSTNNVAEYYALIAALDYAQAHRIGKLSVRSDSELLVRQITGHYRVKSLALRQLHERARRLAGSLDYFAIEHVPREANAEADRLANEALDESTTARQPAFSRSKTPATSRSPLATQTVRARYSRGALHPLEPLELAEDEEVEITIHPSKGGRG